MIKVTITSLEIEEYDPLDEIIYGIKYPAWEKCIKCGAKINKSDRDAALDEDSFSYRCPEHRSE